MSAPSIPLPKNWADRVKSAPVRVFSLARITEAATQGETIESGNARVREMAKVAQLEQELALVLEELQIKDARMGRMAPAKRPHYQGTERLNILERREARGWTTAQTAERFPVTEATISSWNGKLDEQGEDALMMMPEPVNRYPDFVRHAVQRLQSLCPRLGKVKIAQILTRAGLHIATSTVGRIRREEPFTNPRSQRNALTPNTRTMFGTSISRSCRSRVGGCRGCPSRCRRSTRSVGGSPPSSITVRAVFLASERSGRSPRPNS